jgi:hypothetical protein
LNRKKKDNIAIPEIITVSRFLALRIVNNDIIMKAKMRDRAKNKDKAAFTFDNAIWFIVLLYVFDISKFDVR